MVTKSTKAPPATKKEPITRSFYWLDELVASKTLNPKHYSAKDLLDFAATGQLVMSFSVSSRYVVAGDYEGHEEVFEPPHPADTYSGLLPLLPDAVWKIISEGSATIEYLFRNDYEFRKLLPGSGEVPFPVVGLDHVMVTTDDWDRFAKGLPSEPKYPEKPEDPKIIGALVYLYASAANKPEFFTKTGKLVVKKVVEDILQIVSDADANPIFGMGSSIVHEKISLAISMMEPKIIKLQGGSPSK